MLVVHELLVVDDSSAVREEVSAILRERGHQVCTAENGTVALQQASDHQFDAVITDMSMPGMDGIGLIRGLRALEQYQSTPIFVLTTLGDTKLVRQGKEAGASAWLLKPCKPDMLVRSLEQAIKRTNAER